MNHNKKLYLLLVSFLLSLAAYAQNDEFRATWVITWHYIDKNLTVEQNKSRIIYILESHKKANMNAVIWQVRQGGSAYYQSSYEPWGPYAGDTYPGFDPLAFVIEEAHKRGLEVHAWFNTFHIGTNTPDRVTGKHPDWICTNQSGAAMTKNFCISPGIPAAREYNLDVIMEIVNNYDIDGLHLDYIRWNEYDETDMKSEVSTMLPDGMISKERLDRLGSSKSEAGRFIYDTYHPYSAGVPDGFGSWADWRRDAVTKQVKMIHDSIQLVKPHVRLSVAALGKYKAGGTTGWNGYYVVFQDAALWFNNGDIDQLTPMHYHWVTGSSMLSAIETDWEPEIQPGIAAGRLYSVGPGSYVLEQNNVWSNHPGIVNSCRTKTWIDGFQFFSYGSWLNFNYWQEAGETFFSRLTRVRPVFFFAPPSPPALSISKVSDTQYQLTVTPATAEGCWYLIYRSEDANFDPDTDDIVSHLFSKTPFTAGDQYDGLQNFNGRYTYFATASNRFRNESAPSNAVLTDPVPSLAPVVKSTVPLANAVVSINAALQFVFSKSIDPATINAAFTIQPSVPCTFAWTDSNKKVTVSFNSALAYSTVYQATLSPALKDVNGKSIDGNGDGVPGDAFTLSFSTEAPDSQGPRMTHSTVLNNSLNVDIASVISLTFNEMIDPASLPASKVTLKNSNNVNVAFGSALYESTGKSVLSVSPNSLLEFNKRYTLTVSGTFTDLHGNPAGSDIVISFTTSKYRYTDLLMIDDFTTLSGWQSPSFSGSTTGLNAGESSFLITTAYGIPSNPTKNSSVLSYSWIPDAGTYLIREYLAPDYPPALVEFDTTWYLQVYLFGDSSNNRFRFCIDENDGSVWTDHEVSQWQQINWRGWKLIEWKLSDPGSVGSWISANNKLLGPKYRTDSFQFTRTASSSLAGSLYFDNYRIVKKVLDLTAIEDNPADGLMMTPAPNPFVLSTSVRIRPEVSGHYRMTVFSLSGEVTEVPLDSWLTPGSYDIALGEDYSAGVYLVELRYGSARQVIRIIKTGN